MRVFSTNHDELLAEASVGDFHGMTGIFLESRSGKKGGSHERNPDYFPALEAIIARCQHAGIYDHRAWIASSRLEHLPLDQRSIRVDGRGKGPEDVRKEICRLQVSVKQNEESRGGCPVKRIFIPIESDKLTAKAALLGVDSELRSSEEELESYGDVLLSHDLRESMIRAIKARRGQSKFRNSLIQAYDGTCAVSGCRVLSILEAAHISPYRGSHTNRVDNGILLRTDWHTLFDLGLYIIRPDYTIHLAAELKGTDYWKHHGRSLSNLPSIEKYRPNKQFLQSLTPAL